MTTEVNVPYGFSNGLDARSAVNIINSTVLARGYAYGIASDISISIRGEKTVLTAEALYISSASAAMAVGGSIELNGLSISIIDGRFF